MRTGTVSSADIRTDAHRLTGGFHLSEDQVAIARLRRVRLPTMRLADL